ncbi:MAG: Asp23/Gls24 family envelope stress response protein [Lachnospiraceae bacterium]|nr:Asp23/Gls24 family envelope stress response protein [Lachnospiraceae bacterium]
MAEGRNTYTIRDDGGLSTVKIAEDVVAIIAGMAATEAKGVSSLAGNITNDSIPKKGAKSLAKGVHIDVDEENKVKVNLALTIEYGYSIPEVARDVQERVKNGIESMTGMEVTEVNISVGDVEMKEED